MPQYRLEERWRDAGCRKLSSMSMTSVACVVRCMANSVPGQIPFSVIWRPYLALDAVRRTMNNVVSTEYTGKKYEYKQAIFPIIRSRCRNMIINLVYYADLINICNFNTPVLGIFGLPVLVADIAGMGEG